MKRYQLIHLNTHDYLELRCFEDEMYFDAQIQIFLCCERDEYILLDDILGYALAELRAHFYKIDSFELTPEFLDVEIGKAQNEYYYRFAHDLPFDSSAIKEVNGMWIGNKYSCFESRNFSTWVYSIKGQCYLKVTPLYSENYEENPKISYADFLRKYKIIYERRLEQKEVTECQNMIKELERIIK